ncbi:hypothetical protein ACA910_001519 [Epithemia clementina (nom. ined.)]
MTNIHENGFIYDDDSGGGKISAINEETHSTSNTHRAYEQTDELEEQEILNDEPSVLLSTNSITHNIAQFQKDQTQIDQPPPQPPPQDNQQPQDERPPHPLTNASFLSRLCFQWPWPLLKLGLERPLTDSDLAQVLLEDSSEYNWKYFQSIYNCHTSDEDEQEHQDINDDCNKNNQKKNNNFTSHCFVQHPSSSLRRALLIDYFTSETWILQPLIVTAFVAKVVQAVCLGFLINTFENTDGKQQNGEGYYWATGIVTSGLVILLEFHTYAFTSWRKGMQYRIASIVAILNKTLRLSSTHPETLASNGRILNLASNDVERFRFACIFINWLIWAPLQALGILCVGWFWLVGPAFAVGVAVLATVFVPLQMYLSRQFAISRSRIASLTDERVNFVSQAIRGARVMKTSGYEMSFLQRIQVLRAREVEQLKRAMYFMVANESLFFATNVVVSVIVFLFHVLVFKSDDGSQNSFTPGDVFTVFTLVNVMQLELVKHGSLGLMAVSECSVSIQRIQEFLEFPEHTRATGNTAATDSEAQSKQQVLQGGKRNKGSSDDVCVFDNQDGCVAASGPDEIAVTASSSSTTAEAVHDSTEQGSSSIMICMKNVCCQWDYVKQIVKNTASRDKGISTSEKDKVTSARNGPTLSLALENVTVDFEVGTLTCVIGPVGSGKSALLLALVDELAVTSGSIYRRPHQTLAYVAQDPWIMDGSIRENILMGHPFNAEWYADVIQSCSLGMDFGQLRDGDHSLVGDRGVQLSGGQRARISLARALYKNADILIADDPLSAVDARVGRHIFQEAIMRLSVHKGKCVVVATHQHQHIHDSRCLLVTSGRIECIGSYQQCVEASNGKLKAHDADSAVVAQNDPPSDSSDSNTDTKEGRDIDTNSNTEAESLGTSDLDVTGSNDKDCQARKMEQAERNNQGFVEVETYAEYIKSLGGVCVLVFLVVLYTCTQGSVLVATAAMARWAERDVKDQQEADIVAIVIGMSALVVFLSIIRAYFSLSLTLKASQMLHDRMADAVMRAKIEFFDTNPLGRILNRFSADVGITDDQLPQTLLDLFVISFIVFGAVVTAVTTLPVALVVLPFLIWYFSRVRKIFVTSTRELKRLEGIARSPIFAMLSEALGGIATIRANGYISYFRNKFQEVHDAHTRTFFAFLSASRWVGFRMDSIVFLFTSIVSFLAVVVQSGGWFDVDPAILGLALSMLIYLSGIFQWCIRQSAEAVNQMVSVERILEFGKLDSEAPLECDIDNELAKNDWPSAGNIEYENISVRYRKALPLALRRISFRIPAGARVGVVGRTGSGKSTVVQSLFRLLEPEEGRILIDGQDISKVGLHALRTRISVIPQLPTLFSGCTVRDNLDLFRQHSDDEIRKVLLSCHLQEAVSELPNGWNSIVFEGGSNFSVGQRQLLCLARALLSKNKILVLDEATASVDRRTDHLLQQALQESYRDGTILAVAHRLDTVIDYDLILVLGQGGVLEFGAPSALLSNKNGVFARMVDDTGEAMSKTLREKASCSGRK